MRQSLECNQAFTSALDSDEPDIEVDKRSIRRSRRTTLPFLSATPISSLHCCIVVGVGSFVVLLTVAVSIFMKELFHASSNPPSNGRALVYFSELLERIKAERRWTAEPNENAFQRRELAEYGVEVRKAENYSSTAYQGEFERIYASTFHARDNYQLTFDMLTKFHIPPTVAERFDAREHWPLCRSSTAKVYDQGACWNYWLLSTLSTIEDRICIASNGEEKMRLSMFHLLTCCQECGGCRGGNPEAVYIYWVKYGITTEMCQPSHGLFSSIETNCGSPCPLSIVKKADRQLRLHIKPCHSECLNPEHRYLDIYDRTQTNVHYGDYVNLIQKTAISERRAKSWDRGEIVRRQLYIDDAKWLDLVKKELFLRGPLSMDLLLDDDFFLYRSGMCAFQHCFID
uniref:Peptidase C1A papain C-terminal domain-containing protein n=5 Tax=Parascaris univalens TaxID=6257 RepID=A0A915BQW9_PARUN